MNKKQLSLQNSSLFAELERKAKEIEILGIRLEESENKINSLKSEKEQLKNGMAAANDEILKLKGQIEQLKADYENQIQLLSSELEKAKSEPATVQIVQAPPTEAVTYNNEDVFDFDQNTKDTAFEETEIPSNDINNNEPMPVFEQEEIEAVEENKVIETENEGLEVAAETVETKNEVPKEDEAYSPAAEFNIKTPATDSAPITDLLRDHGAKIIGKVTRVTAEVISKINVADEDAAASLKTLALGKNESFKFKVMELAKKGGDLDRVIAEMDFLADEAIIYLRSI